MPSSDPAPIPSTTLESSGPARVGAVVFRLRSWMPVPLIIVMLAMPAHSGVGDWIVGFVLVVTGEAIRLAGVAAAGTGTRRRTREVPVLATHGVFGWVRNPLYLGNVFIWMGFVVASGVRWFVPVAFLCVALEYFFIVAYEEAVLESTFGAEYRRYKEITPRWIPRPPASATAGLHDWRDAWRSEFSTFQQFVIISGLLALKRHYW